MSAVLEDVAPADTTGSELRSALARIAELEAELRRVRHDLASAPAPLTEMRLLDVEAWLVKHAMERAKGNISRAARALGLSRAALYRRLERHSLPRLDGDTA